MAETKEKAEIIPVKKEKESKRLTPGNLLTPFEEMERWAEDFFPRGWLRPHRWDWPASTRLSSMLEERMPKVDIVDRDDEVFIKAELPGIDKKDIEVSMTDNTITIKGSSRKEEKEEKGDYYRCEITQGAFSRSLSLPATVNIDKSKAKFKDGVLELTLPKTEQAKRRNIKID
jgi:HSP20 family protein